MQIDFDAMEFRADQQFHKTAYSYQGSETSGWTIYREGEIYLQLPAGYRLLKTLYCGVCSTDIARAQLPFPFPQITGHEIVALDQGKPVAVEINASHAARGVGDGCFYCENNLANHCPDRLTLGIERLPGGFAPYFLAPVNSIIPLPQGIDPLTAVITEPLAAAIRAVEKTPLANCNSVAVLGPRRLGSLLLLALNEYRRTHGGNFELTAIIRHPELEALCLSAGADKVLNTSDVKNETFDIVFDCSGSILGFETSLQLARQAVHLKSTSGQTYQGLEILTKLVIDENSIHPFIPGAINQNMRCLIDKSLVAQLQKTIENYSVYDLLKKILPVASSDSAQYDAIILSNLADLNTLLTTGKHGSMLKPEGKIFLYSLAGSNDSSYLENLINEKHLSVLSSRCGDFNKALQLIKRTPNISEFCRHFISHKFSCTELNEAFNYVKTHVNCVKAVIDFEA